MTPRAPSSAAALPPEVRALASEAAAALRAALGPVGVVLYGSWARGTAAPRSDLDLAVEAGAPLGAGDMAKARAALEGLRTLRAVSVMDLRAASPGLAAEVRRDGLSL